MTFETPYNKDGKDPEGKIHHSLVAGEDAGMKKIFDDAESTLLGKIDPVKLSKQRYEYLIGVIKDIAITPLNAQRNKWEQVKSTARLNNTYQELNALGGEIAKEVSKITEEMSLYIEKMKKDSENGEVTPEVAAAMRDSQRSARKVAEIIMLDREKYQDLLDAYKWALGGSKKDQGGEHSNSSLNDGKEAFKALFKHLEDPKVAHFCWTIISFAEPIDREGFIGFYMQENNLKPGSPELLTFLKRGNASGAFDTGMMEKYYFLGEKKQFAQSERQTYDLAYKLQRSFHDQAAHLMRESYGSRNVWDGITFGKMLLAGLEVAAWGTGSANFILNTVRPGALKNPTELAQNILTNPYILGSGAVIWGLREFRKEYKEGEHMLASKEEAETKVRAQKVLYEEVRFSRPWREVFESQDFFGAKAIGDFIIAKSTDNQIPSDASLKIDTCILWQRGKAKELKAEGKAKEAEKHETLAAKLEEMSKEGKAEEVNQQFRRFSRAFFVLNIGGVEAKRTYQNAIATAPINPLDNATT